MADHPSSDPSHPLSSSMLPHELVASLVLAAHAALPASLHPAPTPTCPTWTPLAGVVLLPPPAGAAGSPDQLAPIVVALGTGSKVLPEDRKSPHGDLVVDMHAEVLAIRGARRWFADELVRCASRPSADRQASGAGCWLDPVEGARGQRWRLREGVQVWLYASDVPCGEASTAFLARQQLLHDPAMASLKQTSTLSCQAAAAADGPTRGRAAYGRARTLRTKPGRPDAPPARSLSCSDKLAQHTLLGVQGALLTEVLDNVWLEGVVLGPVAADEDGQALVDEVQEALSGRVVRELQECTGYQDSLPALYATAHPLQVHLSAVPFPFSRVGLPPTPAPTPSPFCTIWVAGLPKAEKLAAGGFKLGAPKRRGSDAVLPPASRSAVCKLSWAGTVARVWDVLGKESVAGATYRALKASGLRIVANDDEDDGSPDRKRLRRDMDGTCLQASNGGSAAAYQHAKDISRRPGALFEGWEIGEARWEGFTVPSP